MVSQASKKLGQKGEAQALVFLKAKGYELIAANQRFSVGEIDLLMRDGATLVVVEVKTQTSASLLNPVWKITPAKQRKLRLLAQIVAARHPQQNVRIDAVTLYWNQFGQPVITHLMNII